jgi:hypothetical protein
MAGFKETILDILEHGSDAFAKLKAIDKWSMDSVWENLGLIIEAVEDGFQAIASLKEKLGGLVNDDEAQNELAELLDDAIKLNAMLEAVDGMIFKVIIKAVCTAIAPYVKEEA